MAFGLKNRYGEVISVGQQSAAGGTQMVNAQNMTGGLTLLNQNASNTTLGRPFQILNNTSGGAQVLTLPAPNSCLGQKFYISETGNANPINVQAGGSTIRAVQNRTIVVVALNNGANSQGEWYVVSDST